LNKTVAEEYAFNVAMKYKTEKYAQKKTKKSANLKNMPQNQYQRLKT
jgi:hypothetical protein